MPEGLTPWVVQGGAVTIVIAIVYMILQGKLVPKSTVDNIRADAQAAIVREQEATKIWKQAFEVSQADKREGEKNLSKAIDGLNTVEFLIRALRLEPHEEDTRGTLALEAKREAVRPD